MNRLSRLFFIALLTCSLPFAETAFAAKNNTPAKTSKKTTASSAARPESKTKAPNILAIRTGMNGGKTRIVIETDKAVTFRAFILSDPSRLIVDVPQANWKTQQNRGLTADMIKGYRSGPLDNGLTRIAFDLRKTAVVDSAFALPPTGTNNHRIVIDMQPSSKNTFDAQVKRVSGNENIVASVADKKPVPESLQRGMMLKAEQNKIPTEDPVEETSSAKSTSAASSASVTLPQKKPSFTQAAASAAIATTRPAKRDKYVVVIDAGHGGDDPGAIGVGNLREKDITLAVAKELRRQLEETGRYRVVMTRDRDIYIPLRGRVDISRQKSGDIFVSIHADKVDRDNTRGASIYTLSSTASDAETARLAEQENNAGVVAGVDLSGESHDVAGILLDLSMREKMNESNLFAGYIRESFKRESVQLLPNSHRSAGFAVLKAPDVPSVLIETGFLSNPQDAKLLNSQDFHRRLARGMVGGIDAFFTKMASLQGF